MNAEQEDFDSNVANFIKKKHQKAIIFYLLSLIALLIAITDWQIFSTLKVAILRNDTPLFIIAGLLMGLAVNNHQKTTEVELLLDAQKLLKKQES